MNDHLLRPSQEYRDYCRRMKAQDYAEDVLRNALYEAMQYDWGGDMVPPEVAKRLERLAYGETRKEEADYG